jgi:plasmid stability protein
MPKTIQLRNVPDSLHRKLKSRAARAGISLSDYLLREIREIANRPTLEDFQRRLRRRKPVVLPVSAAENIREEREKRDNHLWNLMSVRRVGDQ